MMNGWKKVKKERKQTGTKMRKKMKGRYQEVEIWNEF